jgi:hypothetical protein
MAQVFTAQNTGPLTKAQIATLKSGNPGDWIVSINAVGATGTPTNTVLATTVIPDSTVPSGDATLTADFAIPAAVSAGQQYALVFTRPASNLLGVKYVAGNPCLGQAWVSATQTGSFVSFCVDCDLVFAVFVGNPAPAAEQQGDPAPDTTITGQPKAKTKKKAATFTFTSTEADSSFECSLNGATFAACASPFTVKGKKGKNHFEVRAKDAAGNVDATPATFDWKVKKRK